MTNSKAIIDRIIGTSKASAEEILTLLYATPPTELFSAANTVKEHYFGNRIILRGIIEFSSWCRCSCAYCGLLRGNSDLDRFRLSATDIVQYAKEAYAAGYRSIILQSGEDLHYDGDSVSELIIRIKQIGDLSITLSIGERSKEEYRQWHKDGADRYLLKHETADEGLYNSLHPHSSFRKRIDCIRQLKEIGYETGSGFMVGLPGQSPESLAKDILLLQELEVEMAGIGIFISHPETPLAGAASGDTLTAVKCVAISRLLMKKIHLPSTTSIEVGSTEKFSSLSAGANVIMKKVEPYCFRKMYEIYPNPKIVDKTVAEERLELEAFIRMQGMTVDQTTGLTGDTAGHFDRPRQQSADRI